MTNFTIDITSDPVCIWCYIGRKRLDKAIALYKKIYPNGRHDTFTVNWKAYYLDPSAPTRGIPIAERMLQKVTSSKAGRDPTSEDKALAQHLTERLASLGRQEGITISGRGKIGNTRSAHRAIAFSKTQPVPAEECSQDAPESSVASVQDRFVMALFAAYFEGAADITSHEDLAGVAESIGLSRTGMLEWLDSGKGGEEVDEQDRIAKDTGLKGVPHFTVQGRKVDGSRDVQDFLELLVKVKEEEQEQGQAMQASLRRAVEPITT
ncbi:putative thioredoxin [Xylaria grammica]|nr:putative thioredoxin [Xylaria grammica]